MKDTVVVIATKNRPVELMKTLASVYKENQRVFHVVVVECLPDVRSLIETRVRELTSLRGLVTTIESGHCSSSTQRNVGVGMAQSLGPRYIQILDDDTVPSGGYIDKLAHILDEEADVIGASGSDLDLRSGKYAPNMLMTLIGLDSAKEGSISRAGCGIPVRSLNTRKSVEWLFGCSLWRSEVFEQVAFNDELPGTALGEDLIFSYQASKLGRLVCDSSIPLDHSPSHEGRPDPYLFAYRFSRNRLIAVGIMNSRLRSLNYHLSVHVLSAIYLYQYLRGDKFALESFRGTLQGYFDGILGKKPR